MWPAFPHTGQMQRKPSPAVCRPQTQGTFLQFSARVAQTAHCPEDRGMWSEFQVGLEVSRRPAQWPLHRGPTSSFSHLPTLQVHIAAWLGAETGSTSCSWADRVALWLQELWPCSCPSHPCRICSASRGPGLEFFTCPWHFLEALSFTGNHKL